MSGGEWKTIRAAIFSETKSKKQRPPHHERGSPARRGRIPHRSDLVEHGSNQMEENEAHQVKPTIQLRWQS